MTSAEAGRTQGCREGAGLKQDLRRESSIWLPCVHACSLRSINLIMAFPHVKTFCDSSLVLGSKPEPLKRPTRPCMICPCPSFLPQIPVLILRPLSPLTCLTLSHAATVCAGLSTWITLSLHLSCLSLPNEHLLMCQISGQKVLLQEAFSDCPLPHLS